MEEEELKQVIDFMREYWPYKGALSADTRLYKDLGITGDDADELVEAFAKKFNLDTSKLDFTKYFYDEGFGLDFVLLYKWIKGEKIYRHKLDMSIGFLANTIKTGKIE